MGEKLLRRAAGRYMKDAFLLTKPCQDHRTVQEGNGIFILGKREGFYGLGQQDTDDVPVFPYTLQRYKQAGIIASIHFRIIIRMTASPASQPGMRSCSVISVSFSNSIFRQGTRQSGWEGYLRVSSSTDCLAEEVLAR